MLSEQSAAVVRATLPAVQAHGVEITGVFYDRMFAAHPELLRLFNRGNQANGEQRRALADAVVAYGAQLAGEPVGAPIDLLVERIANKHVSLGIRPEQYLIVGTHLLAAVGEVLGDAVTPEVAAAWDEVYWLFAVRLIGTEARMYALTGVDPEHPWRPYRVRDRIEDAADAVSFLLVPDDGGAVPRFAPGQYISVAVDLPDGGRQIRQYSLSEGPGADHLRITVRRIPAAGGRPAGVVSNHLHDHVRPGDVLLVGPPAGDITLVDGDDPVVLLSAGVGITPMAAMLDHLARTQPSRPVVAVHADRSPDRHPLRGVTTAAASRLADCRQLTWYEIPADLPDSRHGLVDLAEVPAPADARYYLCGPVPFMRTVRRGLLDRGIPEARISFEVFGPGQLR